MWVIVRRSYRQVGYFRAIRWYPYFQLFFYSLLFNFFNYNSGWRELFFPVGGGWQFDVNAALGFVATADLLHYIYCSIRRFGAWPHDHFVWGLWHHLLALCKDRENVWGYCCHPPVGFQTATSPLIWPTMRFSSVHNWANLWPSHVADGLHLVFLSLVLALFLPVL